MEPANALGSAPPSNPDSPTTTHDKRGVNGLHNNQDLDHDLASESQDFPTIEQALRAVIPKRGRSSPGAAAPSPGLINSSQPKKVNNQPSPNTAAKSNSQVSSSSTLLSSHPLVLTASTTNSGRTDFASAQSSPQSFYTPAPPPSLSASVGSQGTMPSNDSAARRSGSVGGHSRQVDFAPTATQYRYDANEAVSAAPNGSSVTRSQGPAIVPVNSHPFPQTPVVVHGSNSGLNASSASQIFVPGSGHGVTVLQPQQQNSFPHLIPNTHNYPQMSNTGPIPGVYPATFIMDSQGLDPFQAAINNAFLAGQRIANASHMFQNTQGLNMGGEVTVTKDRMIPSAQKIKASLTGIDLLSASKQVRHEC